MGIAERSAEQASKPMGFGTTFVMLPSDRGYNEGVIETLQSEPPACSKSSWALPTAPQQACKSMGFGSTCVILPSSKDDNECVIKTLQSEPPACEK